MWEVKVVVLSSYDEENAAYWFLVKKKGRASRREVIKALKEAAEELLKEDRMISFTDIIKLAISKLKNRGYEELNAVRVGLYEYPVVTFSRIDDFIFESYSRVFGKKLTRKILAHNVGVEEKLIDKALEKSKKVGW